MLRRLLFVLLALLPVPLLEPARAADVEGLPPGEPQVAFSADYRIERNTGGRFDWGRRRVFVAGPLSRDELLDGDIDRATVLGDRERSSLLRFQPDDAARTAKRQAWNDGAGLPLLAQGYGATMLRLGPPRILGERQIAGQACTRLAWEAVGEKQEWCVTPQGLVLAARRLSGVNESKVEVLSLDLAPPDAALFALPPGFTAQE